MTKTYRWKLKMESEKFRLQMYIAVHIVKFYIEQFESVTEFNIINIAQCFYFPSEFFFYFNENLSIKSDRKIVRI